MSTSSPADLAIAFRSLPRRLDEAANDDTPAPAKEAAAAAVHDSIVAAATQLGAAATAEGVGAAIDHRHAGDWSDAELADLQQLAMSAARAIRALEDVTAGS